MQYLFLGKQPQAQQQQFYANQNYSSYTPELFDDMSSSHQSQDVSPPSSMMTPQQPTPTGQSAASPQMMFQGQDLLSNPMANVAMQYGQSFMPAGKEFVEKKV